MTAPSLVQVVSRVPHAQSRWGVFISHAGELKEEVAYPLRDSLRWALLHSFLDAEDLRPSMETVKQQLSAALRNCKVGVFVLWPNFVSKKRPMWELRALLRQKRDAEKKKERGAGLVPLFYIASVEECKDSNLCEKCAETFALQKFFDELRL